MIILVIRDILYGGYEEMRKFLVALFLMLVVGFSFIGVTQHNNESEKVINPQEPANTIQFQS